jgi:methyltransferase (TIGR00027 family)
MKDGRPSVTAERVAMRRAAHQLLDRPLVFEDRLAITILGRSRAAAMREDPRRFETGPAASLLRAFLAVRSRVAEDALAEAVSRGVHQYVVLGAGLDTFAYRNPHPALRVFEVDHPATQAWKRQCLAGADIAVPEQLAWVAADLAREPLADALRAGGLRDDEPTFFSWLGVTPYLVSSDVLTSLTTIAALVGVGGGVVFDYMIPPESLTPRQRAGFEVLAGRAAAAGEPFRSFFEPVTLTAAVEGMGFRRVHDATPDELNAVYFAHREDGLRVGSAGHLMTARG